MATKRTIDGNGYTRIKDNPISKVGVFEYMGSSLGPDFEPDEVYQVYRPESSLNNPETIDSFKCIPWIDEHEMLGGAFTDPEEKGIHGVTGDDAYFEYPYLKVNLNIFSEHLDDIIDNGKKELSPGYRCKYKKETGTFEGEPYQVIQYGMLGNHLATVEEGRTGPDVSVMDHKMTFTFDSKDLVMPKDKKEEFALDEGMKGQMMDAMNGFMKDQMPAMMKDMMGGMMKDMMMKEDKAEDAEEEEPKAEDADKDKAEDKEDKGMDSAAIAKIVDAKVTAALDAAIKPFTDKVNAAETKAMDAANVEAKSKLVEQTSALVGTFDHAEKTLEQTQDYALEQFGLDAADCTSKEKGLMLDVYFKTNKPHQSFAVNAMDSKSTVDFKKYNQESK